MAPRVIDLHSHTTASDGSLTPTELVKLASDSGLAAVGVTDHDTLDGIPEALQAGQKLGVEVVQGIELSLEYPAQFHLLGYLYRPDDQALNARIKYIQEFRASRNVRMLRKIQEYGLPITREDVEAESGGGLIGRPHIALALVRKGIVASTQEAFDRFLGDGKPCHVPKEKMTPEEALQLVRNAGGAPVVAHPFSLKLSAQALEQELKRFKAMGLLGIECYYSKHTPELQALYLELSRKLDLVPTGGSDFHGDSKPHIRLGGVSDGHPVPYALLEGLKAALDEN